MAQLSVESSAVERATFPAIWQSRTNPVREPRGQALDTELAHANRVALVGQLSASIAHEVAQPITGVVTNARVALRLLTAEPGNLEKIQQALMRVVRDGNRASDVIGMLRALVKKTPTRIDCLEINDAIVEALSLTRAEIVKRAVVVETEFAQDLPAIRGDRIQLQQVMLNLIMNAAEAMDAQEDDARRLRITTARTETGGTLVTVEDSGPGMDADELDRIFEAYYTTKTEGMGMGLAICRAIIRSHGGRLWASRGARGGAVFQFTLPGGDYLSEDR